MSRIQVTIWSSLALLGGIGLITYLLLYVSPWMADSTLNRSAIILFFMGLFMLSTGLGTLTMLSMHKRWPALAGSQRIHVSTNGAVAALRQGLLVGVAISFLAWLAFIQMIDLAFVLVSVVLVILLEVFVQNRD